MASIFIECPSCGWEGKLDDGLVGRRIKCRKCGTSFTAEVGGTYDLQEAGPSPNAGGRARRESPASAPGLVDSTDSNEEAKTIDGLDLESWLDRWPAD